MFHLIVLVSKGQEIKGYLYENDEKTPFIMLAVGENCYKMKTPVASILKSPSDESIYEYVQLSDKKIIAVKSTELSKVLMFEYKPIDTVLKKDTLYNLKDTLLDDVICKRIKINYVRGGYGTDRKEYVPLDTVETILYVNSDVIANTPLSFTSEKLQGIILRYDHVVTEAVFQNGVVVKINKVNSIIAKRMEINENSDTFFRLPIGAKLYENRKAFNEAYRDFFDAIMKEDDKD